MTEWFLIWFLVVETYSGEIDDRGPFAVHMRTHTECVYEAKAKEDNLLDQLGSEVYTRDGELERGQPTMRLGGKLIGFRVGCGPRDK